MMITTPLRPLYGIECISCQCAMQIQIEVGNGHLAGLDQAIRVICDSCLDDRSRGTMHFNDAF